MKDIIEQIIEIDSLAFEKKKKNEEFLKLYPEIKGFPHFFVLDSKGNLLESKNTGELEAGESYDEDKIINWLNTF